MFELVLAGSFVAMILTPALVAAASGKKELQPEQELAPVAPAATHRASPSRTRQSATSRGHQASNPDTTSFQAPTLPLHRTLGLAGR